MIVGLDSRGFLTILISDHKYGISKHLDVILHLLTSVRVNLLNEIVDSLSIVFPFIFYRPP
jgi:hypothetical protein